MATAGHRRGRGGGLTGFLLASIGWLTVARGGLLRVSVVIGLTFVGLFGAVMAFCGVAAMILAQLALLCRSGRQAA